MPGTGIHQNNKTTTQHHQVIYVDYKLDFRVLWSKKTRFRQDIVIAISRWPYTDSVSHLGQLASWLVASPMRRKSFLVTTNKLQIWNVWIVLVCIFLECNLLEIKLPTYLPSVLVSNQSSQSMINLYNMVELRPAWDFLDEIMNIDFHSLV